MTRPSATANGPAKPWPARSETRVGEIRGDVRPWLRAFAGEGDSAQRIEAETNTDGTGCETPRLDQRGEQSRGILRRTAEVEIDGDAGIEMNIVERRADRGAASRQRVTVIADRALKHEGDAVGAVVQIVEDLRVGGLGVGQVDPLHDGPGLACGATGDAACLCGAAVKRLDGDAVIGLGPERGKGRALQRLFDEGFPCRLVGRGKVPGQGEFHHCRQAYRCATGLCPLEATPPSGPKPKRMVTSCGARPRALTRVASRPAASFD